MKARLDNIKKMLRRRRIDALLVTQPENRRYLSGYSARDHSIQETAGVLLIPMVGSPFLLTDSRFLLQAERETEGFQIKLYPRGLLNLLERLLPTLKIRKLAFESHSMVHLQAERLRRMAEKIGVKLVSVTDLVEQQRIRKTDEEIGTLRDAVLLNEHVFQQVYSTLSSGMREVEVALAIEAKMRELGAEGPCFETIVAFGANGANPHAVPGNRCLKNGDIVLIDMGLSLNGYCSDITRTSFFGSPDPIFLERLRIVRKAQLAGIKAVRPGASCREVDLAARRVIKKAGYGKYFGHSLGHGVGLNVHEEPRLSSRSRRKLSPGMVVTVEPGIYIPGWGGIRLENMVVVCENGHEVLNRDTTWLDA